MDKKQAIAAIKKAGFRSDDEIQNARIDMNRRMDILIGFLTSADRVEMARKAAHGSGQGATA